MRYRSAVSPAMAALYLLLTLLLLAGAVLSLTFLTGTIRILLALLDLALAGLLIWAFFSTGYTLDPGALVLRSGPIREVIPYREIRVAARTRGYGFLMALSFDRLELNPGLNPEKGRFVLSPEREDEFLEELKKRCPELEIR